MTLPEKTLTSGYVTGWCSSGAHEGAILMSVGGKQFPSCKAKYSYRGREFICTCSCHAVFRQIAEITGITTSGEELFDMRDLTSRLFGGDIAKESAIPYTTMGSATTGGSVETSPVAAPIPATDVRPIPTVPAPRPPKEFKPTPTGRQARGELEFKVIEILQGFASVGAVGAGITPAIVAGLIDPSKPPSQGAVYAVFQRLADQNLITLANSPFRFTGLGAKAQMHGGILKAKEVSNRETRRHDRGFD